jgi:hypothetical protein
MPKLDRFTWAVVGFVALLLLAAIVTVIRNGNGKNATYLDEDTPAAAVHNAFVALRLGDIAQARSYYSRAALKLINERGYGPLKGNLYQDEHSSRRLRVLDTQLDQQDANLAFVEVSDDTYNTGGLFGSGNTYSNRRMIRLVREDGSWKIDDPDALY